MLDLPSLAQRRLHTRLCYVYKIVHGLLYFPPDVVVTSSALTHNPRSHLLYQPFAHTNSYLHSFIPNSISNWNTLPDYVVSSPSFTSFHCLPCSRVHYLLAQLFVYPCCIIQQKFHRKKMLLSRCWPPLLEHSLRLPVAVQPPGKAHKDSDHTTVIGVVH